MYNRAMSYKNQYGGVIWTNHAIERMVSRGLKQDWAWQAVKYCDTQEKGRRDDTIEFKKRFQEYLVTVIATKNEKREWVVISCWMDPPMVGTEDARKKDAYNKYKKASGWSKIFLTIKRQLGF